MAQNSSAPAVAERLADHATERSLAGHRFRYHLAAGFLQPGDVVMDAACGSGYGADILQARGDVSYIGVDRRIEGPVGNEHRRFVEADLQTWPHDQGFDVFCGFETIEHLPSFEHYVATARQARRWIIVSAPVVPTTHLNPHHCHNFGPGELASLFIGGDWTFFQSVQQPAELSEVYVFARRERRTFQRATPEELAAAQRAAGLA